MVTETVAGVAGQPLSIHINGCDTVSGQNEPEETAGNPIDCRTADLLDARNKARALRKQRPDLAPRPADLIKCIEQWIKAPDDPDLAIAYRKLVREIEGRL